MIDEPPEEAPSPVIIESLMPPKEWAKDICDSFKTQAACGFIIARGSHVILDPDDVVARLDTSLAELTSPTK